LGPPAKTDETPAKTDEDATPKASAKPVRHTPSASSTTKDGTDKGDSAGGPKQHPHKAEGRGHSAR